MVAMKQNEREFNVGDGWDDARRYNAEHKQEYTKLRKTLRKAYQEYEDAWDGEQEWTPPPNAVFFWRKYVPEDYPQYDNYDAIEVAHTWDIPRDYTGVMGVPITFIGLCPMWHNYFDIVSMGEKTFPAMGVLDDAQIDGKRIYKRIAIRWQPWYMCPGDYGVTEKEWMEMCGWDEESVEELFSGMEKVHN